MYIVALVIAPVEVFPANRGSNAAQVPFITSGHLSLAAPCQEVFQNTNRSPQSVALSHILNV
jgi:hypothetical protein